MNGVLLTILILVNIPLYLLLGKSFFGGWNGFFESLVAIIQPGIGSALSGKHEEHRIGRFTLIMFLIVCIATTAAEYHVIAKYILGMEHPWG